MTSFRILPAARAELREAVAWYQARRAGTGLELMKEVRRAVSAIVEAPERWPRWSAKRAERKVLLRRFPYLVVYEIFGGEVVIKAFPHTRRRAAYWRGRSPK